MKIDSLAPSLSASTKDNIKAALESPVFRLDNIAKLATLSRIPLSVNFPKLDL